jgi:hypothetical protein
MAKLSFDYSKFDNIVDSDEEEAHHPNLDRGLNQRVIRITRDRKEEEIDTKKSELEAAGKLAEAEKLEKQRPLHVGNMGYVVEERTIINSASGTKDRLVKDGEEFPIEDYSSFKQDNEKVLKEFIQADWETSEELLKKHGDALLDECANGFFMLTALEEEMNGNTAYVKKVVRQGQIVSQIRQLAQGFRRPPRDFVHRWFEKMQADAGQAAFQEGVDHFYAQIQKRAVQKKEEQAKLKESPPPAAQLMSADSAAARDALPLVEVMYDMSADMRKSLAPKGLDPVKVYEALPELMKEAFKTTNMEKLKEAEEKLEAAVFERHFQLCKDSGLWEEELNAFVHLQCND